MNIDDLTKRVARGSGFVFVGNVLGKVVSFVLQVLLSRTLGRAAYGLYTLGFTVLRFAREVAALGLQGGIVRFGAEEYGREDVAKLKGTFLASLGLTAAGGVVVGLVLYVTSTWLAETVFSDPALAPVLQVFSAALPFYALLYVTSRAARALQRMGHDVAISTVLQPAVNVACVVVAFGLGYRLGGATVAFFVSAAVSAGVGLVLIVRLFPDLLSSVTPDVRLGALVRYSLPVLGSSLSIFFLDQTDRLMLGALSTSENVGLYNAAALMATQIRFVMNSVSATFTPVISDLYHQGKHGELERLYKTTTRWIVALALPIALVLFLFPGPILSLFGPEFPVASLTLVVLAVSTLIDCAVGASGLMLQMSDYVRLTFVNTVSLAILNVTLNVLFIEWYGLIGAAIATGLSVTAINAVRLVEVRFLLGTHPFSTDYLKPLVAALAAGGCGYVLVELLSGVLTWTWLVAGPVTLLVYTGAVFAFGLSDDDWTVLGPLLRKAGLDPERFR